MESQITNIKHNTKKINYNVPTNDLEYGAYLIRQLESNDLIVMIKNNICLNFIGKDSYCGFNKHEFNTFYEYYEIIGQIEEMTISDIELEK